MKTNPFQSPSLHMLKPFVLLFFVLFLAACGGGGGDGTEESAGGTPSDSVTATVGSGGGNVSLPDKTVVTIDPGILKDGTIITVTTGPAPASTSAEIQPISPLITVTIPPGSLLQSSASGLEGISVEIPLNGVKTNPTAAVKSAPDLITKSYQVLEATLKIGKDQAVYYGEIIADATVATGKITYKAISGLGQAVGDLELKGVQFVGEFIGKKIQPNVPTAGILFKIERDGSFRNSLTPPRSDFPDKKLPLVLVHGIQLGCDGNAEAYIEAWKDFVSSFLVSNELQIKYEPYSFSYQTDLSIKENGRLLATALKAVFGERPSIVVAHSMGGLVTRSAMVHHASIGANIGGVISLSTPHHGTKLFDKAGKFIDKVFCYGATEAQGWKDLAWDNFDDLSKGCGNSFLCGEDGLNKKDNENNYQKYIPYAGVWDPNSLQCLFSLGTLQVTEFIMCEGANLLGSLRYESDGLVPVVSARFNQDTPQWANKPRTYPGIHHVTIHDDPVVLDQVTQDLLALYDSIPVTNTPPIPTITSPSGGTFNQGDTVTFSGTGNDAEDGVLSGGSLVWTSSIDGPIGTGTSFTKSNLSLGTHVITLKVTDSQGASKSDLASITIDGIPVGPASLSISKPGTGSGIVTSTDGSINCGASCGASFNGGEIVDLTATSDSGSDFSGWGGACAGAVGMTCTLTMNADKAVTATFTPQGVSPPTAKIYFPPPVSMTDAAQITVRGTATDAAGLSSVFVNGVAASTSDAFANWQAVVPLSPGDNTLAVQTTNTLGITNTNAASASIKRQAIFKFPIAVALDAANSRALVIDSFGTLATLFAVDLATGNRSILSGTGTGTGINFSFPQGVALDAANSRALVSEPGLPALLAVDLATGNRSILSGTVTGTGTNFNSPHGVALDAANNRALVSDVNLDALFAVDLATGNRSILSGTGTGTGTNFIAPTGVALDAANNRALVSDAGLNALFAVDLATGNRSILSGTGTGTAGVVIDAPNNRVLVADVNLNGLFAVDLTTGNLSILSNAATGTGINFSDPRGIALDAANNRALVADVNLDALFAVDLTTGNRSILSDTGTGTGTNFISPIAVALDAANNRALVIGSSALFAVDLTTGTRRIFSGTGTGTGPNFSGPTGIALDAANNRALVADVHLDALVAVDLASGNRSILSGTGTGTGPNFSVPSAVALDAANNRVLVSDPGPGLDVLLAVDLATGNRSILSGTVTGTGTNFNSPHGVALDAANNRALVTDLSPNALFAVDLTTGNLSILSGAGTGTGTNFITPTGVALDAANNRALVIDSNPVLDALFGVDLATGNRSILSGAGTGTGPIFGDPFGIALDAANNRALVPDTRLNALFAVDLVNGERVVISR